VCAGQAEGAAQHLHTHLNHIVREALPPVVNSDASDALPPIVTDGQVGPADTKHFPPPPSYLKEEVFPLTAAPLPLLTWRAHLSPPSSSFSSQAEPVKQTPYPSLSTMDPPFHRNEPHSNSRCYHLHCAAYPPSSFPQEMPANSVVVSTWVCLTLLPWVMIKNSSVAVTTWVVSDNILSPLSEHPQLVAVPTQPVDGLTLLPPHSHHDVCSEWLDKQTVRIDL
jgi:hypothetical protein